jgi:hypothetical protein
MMLAACADQRMAREMSRGWTETGRRSVMPSDGDAHSSLDSLDVVAIGAGPAGEAAAQLAGTLRYSVALEVLNRLGPEVLQAMFLPSAAYRI